METYNDPTPINDISINSPITLKDVKDAIGYLGLKKKASVGLDGLSYTILNHLPEQ